MSPFDRQKEVESVSPSYMHPLERIHRYIDYAKTGQNDLIDLVNKQVEKKSMAEIVRQQITQSVSEEDVMTMTMTMTMITVY